MASAASVRNVHLCTFKKWNVSEIFGVDVAVNSVGLCLLLVSLVNFKTDHMIMIHVSVNV